VIFLDTLIEFVVWMIECAMVLLHPGSIEPRRASLLDLSPGERRARRWRLALGCVSLLLIVVIALAVLAIFK
jgi:hypothetical protein